MKINNLDIKIEKCGASRYFVYELYSDDDGTFLSHQNQHIKIGDDPNETGNKQIDFLKGKISRKHPNWEFVEDEDMGGNIARLIWHVKE